MYRMGMLFGAAKISNIVWGMPSIPDIIFGKQWWVQAYVTRTLESIPCIQCCLCSS